MRTTLILEDELIKKAMSLSHQTEKTKVIHLGLKALIEKLSREQIQKLAGSDKKFKAGQRNR